MVVWFGRSVVGCSFFIYTGDGFSMTEHRHRYAVNCPGEGTETPTHPSIYVKGWVVGWRGSRGGGGVYQKVTGKGCWSRAMECGKSDGTCKREVSEHRGRMLVEHGKRDKGLGGMDGREHESVLSPLP